MSEPKVTGEDPDVTRVFERPSASGVDPVTAQLDDATLISDPLPDGRLVSPPVPPVPPEAAEAAVAAAGAAGAAVAASPEPTGWRARMGDVKMALSQADAMVPDGPVGARPQVTRKARLRVSRLDPWSVMKTSFMFSIAFAVVTFVVVWVIWGIIDASGALDSLQSSIDALVGTPDNTSAFQVSAFVDLWRVLGFTALIGVVNVVLLTALGTLGAFLYNLSATLLGGIEITLAED